MKLNPLSLLRPMQIDDSSMFTLHKIFVPIKKNPPGVSPVVLVAGPRRRPSLSISNTPVKNTTGDLSRTTF